MDIYLFSDRTPDPKMLKDLGGAITARFQGNISDIRRRDNHITFNETLRLSGQTLNVCHIISVESIVVVEEPILLQEDWLKAGIATLLVPQMTQETSGWRNISFKYCKLLQIHQIEVTTSEWTGTNLNRPPLAIETE